MTCGALRFSSMGINRRSGQALRRLYVDTFPIIRPEGAGLSLRAQRLNGVGGQMTCTRKADKNVRPTRRVGAVLAAAAALAGAANLGAGIAFDPTTSTLKITHDADINNPNDTPFVKNPSTVPPSSLIYPVNSYQMNHTFTFVSSGDNPVTSTTIAAGSLGQVTNATTASFILATGTGVTQDD